MEEIIAIIAAIVIYLTYTLLVRQTWFRRGPALALSIVAAAFFIYNATLPEPHPRSLRVVLALIMIRGVWVQWKAFQEWRQVMGH
jgi:hypothetical protein